MTSAVGQAGKQHVGCFGAPRDGSTLRGCLSPLWFQEKTTNSDCTISLLPSRKVTQATAASSREVENDVCESELVSKLEGHSMIPHWIKSEQVQGNYLERQNKIEMPSDDAPCTPAQSYNRQKHQPDETPESVHLLPSLSLSFESERHCKVDMARSSEWKNDPSIGSQQINPHSGQIMSRSYKVSTSTPPKNSASHNRIQLEVQREGSELHKENLLSLSLGKHEKPVQKPDLSPSSGHCVGHPPPQRVLATLGGSKVPPSVDAVCTAQIKSPPLASRLQHVHLRNSSSSLATPGNPNMDCSSLQQARGGNGISKQFDSLSASEATEVRHDFIEQSSEHKSMNVCSFSNELAGNCMPEELDLHTEAVSSGCDHQKNVSSFICNLVSTVKSPVLNPSLSLVPPSLDEGVRYMQLLPSVGMFDTEQQQLPSDDEGRGKRRKESSSAEQEHIDNIARLVSHEQCMLDFFVEDAQIYHREAKKATKKKRQAAAQQFNTPLIKKEVIDVSAKWHEQPLDKLCMPGDHLQRESMKKQINFTSVEAGTINSQWTPSQLDMQVETAVTTHAVTLASASRWKEAVFPPALEKEHGLASDVGNGSEKQLSELPKEEVNNRREVGSKLFAFPAYAQMPKSMSTFSTGEPSLPLSLDIDGKLPGVGNGKDPSSVDTTNDADWGKFLALSATPAASTPVNNTSNLLPYQQRFQRLQAFLKQCDGFDQRDQFQALQSLSAAARSGYAVELETRAIRLSLEEGKEMNRMKLLNVLGKNADRNPNDVGATPHGPRLPAPGANAALKHS